MSSGTNLARRFRWLAFPSLIRYIALFQFLSFVLTWISPTLPETLIFDHERLLAGEVWRAFSFLFFPAGAGTSATSLLFAFFGTMLLITFGDGLEAEWGSFRTSLYVYLGWATCLLSSLLAGLIGLPYYPPAMLFDLSILFAFATFYPRHQIMLFFVIPVPVFLIALFAAIPLALACLASPPTAVHVIGCLANYLLFIGPLRLAEMKSQQEVIQRRREFRSKSLPTSEAFHTCEQCGANDQTHPEREFRITTDHRELCSACLDEADSDPTTAPS